MENKVILRELQNADLKPLENIIRQTWNYDKFASPKTAGRLAKIYLATCLTNQTFARVAEVNGMPAGVILGKNAEKHGSPLKYRIRQFAGLLQLFITKEGREILNFYKNIDGIDKRLLEQCEKDYRGEIALFALAPEYRGLGLGKKLFESLLAYMKGEGIEDFYLYTDTSCNFGFYEHQGMTRRQRYSQTMNIKGQKGEMEFYLYDMAV